MAEELVDTTPPRFRKGGGKRKNRDTRKVARKAVADANAIIRASRDDAERLEHLRSIGHGHCAEARRLSGGAS